jgi:hypothetical protein
MQDCCAILESGIGWRERAAAEAVEALDRARTYLARRRLVIAWAMLVNTAFKLLAFCTS